MCLGDQSVFVLLAHWHRDKCHQRPQRLQLLYGSGSSTWARRQPIVTRQVPRSAAPPTTSPSGLLPDQCGTGASDACDKLHLHDAGRGRGRVHRRGLQRLGVGGGVGGAVRFAADRWRRRRRLSTSADPYELADAGLTRRHAQRWLTKECDAAALYLQGAHGAQGADGIPDVTSQGFSAGSPPSATRCSRRARSTTKMRRMATLQQPPPSARGSFRPPTASEPCLIARTDPTRAGIATRRGGRTATPAPARGSCGPTKAAPEAAATRGGFTGLTLSAAAPPAPAAPTFTSVRRAHRRARRRRRRQRRRRRRSATSPSRSATASARRGGLRV